MTPLGVEKPTQYIYHLHIPNNTKTKPTKKTKTPMAKNGQALALFEAYMAFINALGIDIERDTKIEILDIMNKNFDLTVDRLNALLNRLQSQGKPLFKPNYLRSCVESELNRQKLATPVAQPIYNLYYEA